MIVCVFRNPRVQLLWMMRDDRNEKNTYTTQTNKGVGVVTKVGPGVSGLTAGQRVAGCPWAAGAGEGSWQQVCVVSASSVVPVPDGVSDEAAAQFYINPVTVLGLVEASGVKKG